MLPFTTHDSSLVAGSRLLPPPPFTHLAMCHILFSNAPPLPAQSALHEVFMPPLPHTAAGNSKNIKGNFDVGYKKRDCSSHCLSDLCLEHPSFLTVPT